MNTRNKENNIIFLTEDTLLDDNTNNKEKELNINNLLDDFLNTNNTFNNNELNSIISENIWNTNTQYTIKELLKICKYYGIDKYIKGNKCKKQDIIEIISFFENYPENFEIVFQRNKLWTYMNELKTDAKMKQYILWD
jgi:hypothetical protein